MFRLLRIAWRNLVRNRRRSGIALSAMFLALVANTPAIIAASVGYWIVLLARFV